MVDFCIIGAGISALYCAYQLRRRNPTCSIVILEKDNRIGGRVYPYNFDGSTVLLGSGVGRMATDALLLQWLIDLEIEVVEYTKVFEHQDTPFMKSCLRKLQTARRAKNAPPRHLVNFRDFATMVLGENDYQRFKSEASFTDFEEADYVDTVDCYGFHDLIPVGTNYSVPWQLILDRAIGIIGRANIHLSCEVTAITQNEVSYREGSSTKKLEANTIISSCPVPILKQLYPNHKPLDTVGTQTFCRIYAYLDKPLPIQSYHITHDVLQKIIPINPERNLYMIAYADNKSADKCDNLTKDELERLLAEHFSGDFKIRKIKKKYWLVGTHFFYPLSVEYASRDNFIANLQNPMPNHWLIGEAFSNNQGWVEGALESVAELFRKKFHQK